MAPCNTLNRVQFAHLVLFDTRHVIGTHSAQRWIVLIHSLIF